VSHGKLTLDSRCPRVNPLTFCYLAGILLGTMNANELAKLAGLIEEGTLPEWLRREITKRKEELTVAASKGETVVLLGPNGEEFKIDFSKSDRSAA
jgi:hypothetical protein